MALQKELELNFSSGHGSLRDQLLKQGYEISLAKVRDYSIYRKDIYRLRFADLITDDEMHELFIRLTMKISEEINNEIEN